MKTLTHAKKKVEEWRRILGIDPAWSIEVCWIMPGQADDAAAAVDVSHQSTGYYEAQIGIALDPYQDFTKWAPHADRLIVHELLHICLADFTLLADAMAPDNLKPEMERREEQAVTKLTTALVELYRAGMLE